MLWKRVKYSDGLGLLVFIIKKQQQLESKEEAEEREREKKKQETRVEEVLKETPLHEKVIYVGCMSGGIRQN